jgi:hypothetical protein
MKMVLNPLTGRFDIIGMTKDEADAFLKLTGSNQVVTQTPQFDAGITIKKDQWVRLDGV